MKHGTPKEARKIQAGSNNFLSVALRDGGKTDLIMHLGKKNPKKQPKQHQTVKKDFKY